MTRPVDAAMDDERPEKKTIRELWVERILKAKTQRVGTEPVYLTLAGAEGRDIELLVRDKFLTLNEVHGIREEEMELVIAVESSPDAEIQLKDKYPGLRVLRQDIGNVVRSSRLTAWPTGADKNVCRALVINLDLDSPLLAGDEQGQIRFPVIDWVRKFALLHAEDPQLNWTLLLTLHGEIVWTDEESKLVQRFLAENFALEPVFSDACREHLGASLFKAINESTADFSALSWDEQQKLLMAFVPKKLAQVAHADGWLLKTERNLRYGGTGSHAPMVTWILDFVWDPRASSEPGVVYRESLTGVLKSCGRVAEDGTLSA